MNLADFKKLDSWEKLSVVEIELSKKLQKESWTQLGSPNTNVWWIKLEDDGEIHKVLLDGSSLAEKFSKEDCHATASTFYYNENTKKLFVHTSGSDSPAALSGSDPKYSVIAFFWEYISNRAYQLEPCEDILKEENGGFEYWLSLTTIEGWQKTEQGSSTVNRESSQTYNDNSAYSVRLDIDSSDSYVSIWKQIKLKPGRKYRIRFRYMNSTSGKTGLFKIYNTGGNVHLQPDGSWAAAGDIVLSNSTSWATYELTFVSHKDYQDYWITFAKNTATSSSIYFDFAELFRYRRTVDCKVFLGSNAIPSVRQSIGDFYRPDEQIQFGSIKCQNKNGWFYKRQLSNGYLWHHRYVNFKLGKKGDGHEDLTQFFGGVTTKPSFDKEALIPVEDERVLLAKLPVGFYDELQFPACEDEWKGKRRPLLFGPVYDIKPPQIDIENKIFEISQAVFGRKVAYTWYLNDDCSSLVGWTETNSGQGDTSQQTFDDKTCFKHNLGIDGAPANCYTRIYRDVGTLPNSFIFEIKLYHDKEFGPVGENKQIEIDLWNGSINFRARIDSNSIDIYDGAAWDATASTNSQDNWYVYKFVIDGSTPGSETVDIYRNGSSVATNKDCSNADATNDGKIQLTYNGNEVVNSIHYCDFIRAYVENIIDAGTTYGIASIDKVYKISGGTKTTLTPGTDYTTDLPNGRFTVLASLASGDIITCDACGLKCDILTSGKSSPAYSINVGDWILFLYTVLNGISQYKIDLPSILDLRNNRKLACGRWIADETQSIDELIKWKKSAVFQSLPKLEGIHTFPYYKDTVPSDALHFYNEDYASEPKVYEDSKQCFKRVTVKSKYKPYSGIYQYSESAENEATEWEHNVKREISFETILSTQFQGRSLSSNYLAMLKKPPKFIDVPIKNHAALLLNPVDKVYFTFKKKDEEGNEIYKLNEDVFRILTVEKSESTGMTHVTGILDDADFFWVIT